MASEIQGPYMGPHVVAETGGNDRPDLQGSKTGVVANFGSRTDPGRSKSFVPEFGATAGQGLVSPSHRSQVVAEFELAELNAQAIHVTLANPIEPQDDTDPYESIARIEFGGGGIQSYLEIDYLNGSGITIPGSYCRVIAKSAYRNAAPPADLVTFGAFVSQFPTAGGVAPVRSFFSTIASGSSVTVNVPNYARGVRVFALAGDGPLICEVGIRGLGTILASFNVGPNEKMAPFPIVHSCRQFRITNTGAVSTNVVAVFTIAP